MKHKIFLILFIAASLMACQKEITVDLNSSNPQYVIEGNISDQAGPYTVKITRTVNFSDSSVYPAVKGATVIIRDDAGNTDTLSETSAGIYQTKTLQGVAGRTYTLDVRSADQHFTATSQMPQKVSLSSISFEEESFGGMGPDQKKTYQVVPVYTDLANVKNYYRFVMYVNGEKDESFIIRNDNIGDGEVNTRAIMSRDLNIYAGDKVKLELYNIDSNVYLYFYSLNQSARAETTPTNPVSNLTGGALGYFSAQSISAITQTVQ